MERGILRTFKSDGTPVEIGDAEALTKTASSYTLEATDTGKTWIDGRKVFRKYIPLGNIVDTVNVIPHNITALDVSTAILVAGSMYNGTDTTFILPHVSGTAFVRLQINTNNITLTASEALPDSTAFAVYEYCKNELP